MFWKAWAEAGSPPRALPQEAQGKRGMLVPMPKVSDGSKRLDALTSAGDEARPVVEEGRRLPTEVTALSLRLPSDGIHDGVLGVHADGRVVLRVDDGGLAAQSLHLDGLVGRQG